MERLAETGTLTAARMRLYSASALGAPAKIVELVPEGTQVAPGDVLVRFDATQLELMRDKDEAALRFADADLVRAREDLRIEQLRVEGEGEAARQDLTFAEQDLANELDGRGRLQVAEAEAAAAEAGREVDRARRSLADIAPMLAEGFATRAEVERAEQALRRADETHRIAALKLESLTRFERPASIEKSRAGVQAARQGAVRLADSSAARLTQRRAAAAMAESRLEEIRVRLRTLGDQLSRTTIRADGPGLVVYRELFFGSDKRKPQVGDEVWPNQPLMALPDSSELLVETRVREADLHRVSASQRVFVRVEAYPDVRLPAEVALVGALASVDDTRAGTKFFPITIRLQEVDPRLRSGMTARVEIEVASLHAALVVPTGAVFETDADTVCYVLRRGRPEVQVVSVQAENAEFAAIRDGLRVGDVVLLADPTLSP
ncbi:MAG: efflux RND transporter periplasmic adaptor subunit [Acidobacteria bacterium]|nr:efflux RND transporter periplasmic adaptor subunit [Acidobacteriota bacterium]